MTPRDPRSTVRLDHADDAGTRQAPTIALADAQLQRLADLIADRLRPGADAPATAAPTLLTAAEMAQRLGVSREWVYRHSAELGAIRLPGGSKARGRLRFPAAGGRVVVGSPQAQEASNGGRSAPKSRRRSARSPARSPASGSAGAPLASRPRPVPDGARGA